MSNTRDQVIERYGVDPETVGNRHRGWWIVAEIDEEEKVAGAQIGDLCVEARDGAWNEPDMSVGRYPNYRGTSQDYGDETYRRYYFAPLEKPAEAPETPAAGEDVREPTDAQVNDACMWYRHDFGLLDDEEKKHVRFQARGWFRAWGKALSNGDDAAALLRAPRGEGEAGTWGDTPFAAFVVWWQQRFGDVFIDPRVWCYTKVEEAHLAAQRLKENGVPVVLAVAPAALRSEVPGEDIPDEAVTVRLFRAWWQGIDASDAGVHVTDQTTGAEVTVQHGRSLAENKAMAVAALKAIRAARRGEGGEE